MVLLWCALTPRRHWLVGPLLQWAESDPGQRALRTPAPKAGRLSATHARAPAEVAVEAEIAVQNGGAIQESIGIQSTGDSTSLLAGMDGRHLLQIVALQEAAFETVNASPGAHVVQNGGISAMRNGMCQC